MNAARSEPRKKTGRKSGASKEGAAPILQEAHHLHDFTESGFRQWFGALTPRMKSLIHEEGKLVIPPHEIIQALENDPDNRIPTLLLPSLGFLKKLGRGTRLRILSLALKRREEEKHFTFLVNTMEGNRNKAPDIYSKLSLYAEDLSKASSAILGPRIARTMFGNVMTRTVTHTISSMHNLHDRDGYISPENEQGPSMPQVKAAPDMQTPGS